MLETEATPSARVRLVDVATRAASHTSDLDWATFGAAAHTAGITAQLLPASTVDVLLPNDVGEPVRCRIVGTLVDSPFQSELITSDEHFKLESYIALWKDSFCRPAPSWSNF